MTRPEHIERARKLHAIIMNLYFSETIASQIVDVIAAEFARVEAEAVERAALSVEAMPRSEEGYVCKAAVDIAAAIRALKETP